ncbi:hypothetical protein KFK09_022176 [Dendrobium nobile]|uniref:Uncharacterized protein n=1 Tax=Dendrobium nobile TaxID=94219 RepID=A0A8T3AHW7_DENNO|nr:hypothetical protein KFK09_022176 [Dendrobium nobile]
MTAFLLLGLVGLYEDDHYRREQVVEAAIWSCDGCRITGLMSVPDSPRKKGELLSGPM